MFAVVSIDIVRRFKTGTEAGDRCLFTKIEMAIAPYTGFGVHFTGLLLKVADEYHLVIVV